MSPVLVVIVTAAGLQVATAAEQGGASAEHKTLPSNSTPTQATAVPAAAAPRPAQHATTVEGSITAIDLSAEPPTMQVHATNGRTWTLVVDPKTARVWKDLRTGGRVKVHAILKEGKEVADVIQILGTESTTSHAAPSTASY